MNQPVKIEKGMYVRTKCNDFCNMIVIRKVEEKSEDDNGFFIDDYIIDTYGDEQNYLQENDISKCSYDLIDLVEEGDYVNGAKVVQIGKSIEGRKYITTEAYHKINYGNIFSNEIKSIVTKEQFESISYKVD